MCEYPATPKCTWDLPFSRSTSRTMRVKNTQQFFHIFRPLMTVLVSGPKSCFCQGIFYPAQGRGQGQAPPSPAQGRPSPATGPGPGPDSRPRDPQFPRFWSALGHKTAQTRNRCSEPLQASQVAVERSLERSELNLSATTSVVQYGQESGSEQPRQGVKSTKNAFFRWIFGGSVTHSQRTSRASRPPSSRRKKASRGVLPPHSNVCMYKQGTAARVSSF